MPQWLIMWMLPYLIQGLTPFATELVKRMSGYVLSRLPRTAWPIVAAALGEAINQAQQLMTGTALPPGIPGLVSVILNEARNDFVKGMKDAPSRS